MNIYDFDNTIYKGDSTADFYLYCLKKHPGIFLNFPSLFIAFTKYYIFKKGNKTQFKEKMYLFLTHCDTEKDVEEFWKIKIKNIKHWYKLQQREDDLIISASPEFLLTTPCKMLGINYLIASKVDPHTGKYNGENCHGQEKVHRFYKEYPKDTIVEEFYSDSYSDTPLAELAVKSFMVKGDKISEWEFNRL